MVSVTPLADALAEGSEMAVFTLLASATYTIGFPGNATATIADMPADAWRGLVLEMVARHDGMDQSVYFQVTRGVAKRAHEFPVDVQPTVFMMSTPLTMPPAMLSTVTIA